jgi:hypothetical protein
MITKLGRLLLITFLSSCCAGRISLREFSAESLELQIRAYEAAIAHKCVYSERLGLLDAMSQHGYQSADAMADLLEHPVASFPIQDAVTVIRFTHFVGTDLRQHRTMLVLQRLAATPSTDRETQEIARAALYDIQHFDPSARVRR